MKKQFIIILATNNAHKLTEVKEILSPYNILVLSLKEAGLYPDEAEENGLSYKENAIIKAENVAKLTSFPIIADDSGIEISALNNEPGIHSARFADSLGGYPNTFRYILEKLKETSDRKARFVCDIALVNVLSEPLIFEGIVDGSIGEAPEGQGGFGYDPLFISDEMGVAYSSLSKEEKNRTSHRGKALLKMVDYLKANNYLEF